ncbi:MAG: FAD-linked oxidase [Deltaproteobacteria bacterium SG8_13]|nr:MAG: FAD-linked oxidase [Deltaproteobacteria bacterium SG8_13]
MRRWNGWGDESIHVALPEEGARLLRRSLGEGRPQTDCTFESLLHRIPACRIPPHPCIQTDAPTRLIHSHGQSLPDWVGLRAGSLERFPDGVAFPENSEQVEDLFQFCRAQHVIVIPHGGGTSVVGHLQIPAKDLPVLSLSMKRMNQMMALNATDQLATFGAGISGLQLEGTLQPKGFTLGHFPQSFEYSSLGGWVATRSCGQQSSYYGRIEDLYAGGELISPIGRLVLPNFPASAAGPDLRQLVLGSEGRMGVLTRVTVRLSRIPEKDDVYTFFFPTWQSGISAVRTIARAGISFSMMRLSNPAETRTLLSLAGNKGKVDWLERYLRWRGLPRDHACICLIGFTGTRRQVRTARCESLAVIRRNNGIALGKLLGKQWKKNRFRTPYLRNTLWNCGYAVDTFETAVNWDGVTATLTAIETAVGDSLAAWKENVHAFSHLSHVYPTGSSLYTTVVFRLADAAEEILARWRAIKAAACRTITAGGGTISHQHGVGTDHRGYLEKEKGSLGIGLLKQVYRHIDPEGLMNPEKLIE